MVRFDIDLAFSSTEAPGSPGDKPSPDDFFGRVTADGSTIHVFVSDASRLPRGSGSALHDLRIVAAALAKRGVEVSVESTAGTIVRIGAVKSNPLQRLVTWSPHVMLGSPAALAPLLGRRAAPTRIPLPPSTLFPLAPTVARVARRRATTTHYLPGSGRPRLIFVVGSENWDGRPPREFDLRADVITIGSGPEADLRLPGLEPVHAEIRHEDDDEYVLYDIGTTGGGSGWPGLVDGGATTSAQHGTGPRGPRGRILRTGARIDLGDWKLAYFREEFADHGRPFGGRIGGELSHQKKQPPRPGPSAAGSVNTDPR